MRDGVWSWPWKNNIRCVQIGLHLRVSSGITSDGAKYAPSLLLPQQLPFISWQTPMITRRAWMSFIKSDTFGFSCTLPRWCCCPKCFFKVSCHSLLLNKTMTSGVSKNILHRRSKKILHRGSKNILHRGSKNILHRGSKNIPHRGSEIFLYQLNQWFGCKSQGTVIIISCRIQYSLKEILQCQILLQGLRWAERKWSQYFSFNTPQAPTSFLSSWHSTGSLNNLSLWKACRGRIGHIPKLQSSTS